MKIPAPPRAAIKGVSESFQIGQILDLKAGKAVSFGRFIERIASKDLIFFGEVHDNPEHHLMQIQTLQALADCCSPLTIAMEFFERPKQDILDRYIRGELEEAAFLKAVDWKGGWGFDYHLYRPLLLFARQNRIRVLALNAPSDIVKKVARKGLKGLDTAQRDQLAREIDLGNKAHRAYLREIYGGPGHGGLKTFEYFYEAQCVWEETMAQQIAENLGEKGNKMIVFSGNGHIVRKFGIPDRAARRVSVSMATLMPYPLDETVFLDKGLADFLWLTPSFPHRGRMFHK